MTFPAILDVPWPELARGAIDRFSAFATGELGAMLVRQLYSEDEAAELAARLERGTYAFPRSSFPPEFRVSVLGQCLDLADPALDAYFDDALRFREACRSASEGLPGYEERIAELFGALSAGRPVDVPRGPRGEIYAPSTVRRMTDGAYIPPHCEREQCRRPPYHHLRHVIDPSLMLSFYLVLQTPEGGGELGISALRFEALGAAHMNNQRTSVEGILDRYEQRLFAPRPGDVIVFDGGSHIHWVTKVVGERPRYTIGGFASRDPGGETIYYWS
jgi:hypothetical protein